MLLSAFSITTSKVNSQAILEVKQVVEIYLGIERNATTSTQRLGGTEVNF